MASSLPPQSMKDATPPLRKWPAGEGQGVELEGPAATFRQTYLRDNVHVDKYVRVFSP